MESTCNQFDLVSFGEILLRLSPPRHCRIVDSDVFEKRAGGAEFNVVSGVTLLGLRTGIISMLPHNELGTFLKNRIRFTGVSDDLLQYDTSPEARLGTYFYEMGAAPRKPTIVYDRKNSSINRVRIEDVPTDVFTSTTMFHVSGISLALSAELRKFCKDLIIKFKQGGAQISFDVNYRANLWGEDEARNAIEEILPYVDVLFISEESSRRMFKRTGELKDIQKGYCEQYGIKIVASTQRTVISTRAHSFTSLVYSAAQDTHYTQAPYENIEVIDRLGSGDAYVAGALYGLLKYNDAQKAMEFGNATSTLKNTVPGDLPSSDLKEVQNIMREHTSDGPVSEMNR